MRKENDYCVILAGGQGRRLWPYSRKKKPKQFIDFFGNGQSLLQQTYKRFAQFIPEDHIYVSTFAEYADITYEQLPNLPKDNVLLEPVQLSTAPAVGMAHCTIALRDPNANIIISPCDQFIMDEERFTSQLIQGLAFVERNPDFLALGVNPTYPNTGYGYIQMSNETKGQGYARIKSFTEKPEAEFARMFVQSREFLWPLPLERADHGRGTARPVAGRVALPQFVEPRRRPGRGAGGHQVDLRLQPLSGHRPLYPGALPQCVRTEVRLRMGRHGMLERAARGGAQGRGRQLRHARKPGAHVGLPRQPDTPAPRHEGRASGPRRIHDYAQGQPAGHLQE